MNLLLEERELHISMTANDRSIFVVFCDDPVWIARLDKIATAVKAVGEGKTYHLRADQVLLRKGKRAVSDEQRVKLSERMKLLHSGGALRLPKQDTGQNIQTGHADESH